MESSSERKKLTGPDGTTFVLIEPAAANNGVCVEFEITMAPGATGPLRHFHPAQTETWTVLEGELSMLADGGWRPVKAGESVSLSPRTVHTVRNRSGKPVRFRNLHEPALDFQQYIEDLDRLTASGKLAGRMTPPALFYGAMVLTQHRPMQLSASTTKRAMESVLALVGRLLGYRIRA